MTLRWGDIRNHVAFAANMFLNEGWDDVERIGREYAKRTQRILQDSVVQGMF